MLPSTPQLLTSLSRAAVAVAMPAGALGIWYADQYQSTPRKAVPNSISANAVSQNLISAPRRRFHDGTYWLTNGNTVVDSAATAPDGSSDASTVSLSAGNYIQAKNVLTVAAGTYTIAISAKRNTGSNQAFAVGAFGFLGTVQTATAAWQRFSIPVTLGSPTDLTPVPVYDVNSVSPNIQICDFGIFAGASDLGAETPSGHLLLGNNANDTASLPTAGTGYLDFSAPTTPAYGLAQFASGIDLTRVTIVALLSKVAAGNTYQAFFSTAAYLNLEAYAEQNGPLAFMYNTIPATGTVTDGGYEQDHGALLLTGQGYHMMAHRYDQSIMSSWFDDMLLFRQTVGAIAKPTDSDFWIGSDKAGSGILGYKVAAVAFYNRALTDTEIRTAYTFLKARALLSSITVTAAARVVIPEGDSLTSSITDQTTLQTWPNLFGANASPFAYVFVRAMSGSKLVDLNTRAASLDAIIPANKSGRKFILTVWIGANDASYVGGSSQYITDLAAYLDARRAAGWLVVVATLTPQTTGGFNTFRNAVNTGINAWSAGQHYDAKADLAANGTIGGDAAASNATYYNADGIHLIAAGQAIAETIFRAAINGL